MNLFKRFLIILKQNTRMSAASSSITPPERVRGITKLNKSLFDTPITVPTLFIRDVEVSKVLKYVKKYLLKVFHLKPVEKLVNSEVHIMLNPTLIKTWDDLEEIDQRGLKKLAVGPEHLKHKDLVLTYDNYMHYEVFKAILPEHTEGFSSFSQIGHIIHVNLREHMLPFKHLIGQVLLDKVPNARTVVNKTDAIDNIYRNFQMEVLHGDKDLLVTVKQNYCTFTFDFGAVYWNPRLSAEHERILKILNDGDVLFDVFAGVGPFSIPAAKKGCFVYANDLNPESYKWLNYNIEKNKIRTNLIKVFNKDGHDFILNDIKENLIKHLDESQIHITMNLPALAVTFINSLFGLYKSSQLPETFNSPIVHVYCFVIGEDCVDLTHKLISISVNRNINDKIISIVHVRSVSNFKEMMKVSFTLDRDLLVENLKRKHEGVEDEDV